MPNGDAQERGAMLMELAGRCLVRYQRIESALKLLLPHLVAPGAQAPDDPPNWREFLDGKYTLGPLMERFKRGIKADNLESAHAHLAQIVSDRNDLVHHFFTGALRVLASAEGVERGISELRSRLEQSRPLEDALVSMVGEFARELESSRAAIEQKGRDGAP